MFKMYIKMNNSKLNADGLESNMAVLMDIIRNIDSYSIDSSTTDTDGNTEHFISTNKFGDESYLISLLEDTPWFMKYVMIWNTDDNGMFSDMIDVEREMGAMCSYA